MSKTLSLKLPQFFSRARLQAPLLVATLLIIAAAPARSHEPLHEEVEALDRAIAADPGNARLRLERSELHRLDGNSVEAWRDLDRAEALDPALQRVQLCRAAILFETGEMEAALVRLDRYLALESRDGQAVRLRARVLSALGRTAEALADFDRAIPLLDRVTPDDLNERARMAIAAGQDPAAVEANLARSMEALRQPGAPHAAAGQAWSPGRGATTVAGYTMAAAPTAVLTRGPYLQMGTPSSLVIRWRTDVPTDSRVRYGPTPGNLTVTVDDTSVVTEHEVNLTGLAADTRYFYSVGSSLELLAGGDSTCSFVTSPLPGTPKPTRIWILGDSGNPTGWAIPVRNAYDAFTGGRGTDLWLMLGDNAYIAGTDSEYQAAVFDVFGKFLKTSVLWPTRGNHDAIYSGSNNDYYDIFTLPAAGQAGGVPSGSEAYYSFDYGNIHFICLDSEGSDRSPGGPMLTWLAQDLAATDQDWAIAYFHHPPYSRGSHDSDNSLDSGGRMRDVRENALPILEAAGVDLVLTGHSHSYERSCLLDEHYGISTTLVDSMKVDPGDGRILGDGAYLKNGAGLHPHAGAVYTVAGSSSSTGGGSLNHPVMITSLNAPGSVVLDVSGLQLNATFLDQTGQVRDTFSIVKSGPSGVASEPGHKAGVRPVNHPNPFIHTTRIVYTLDRPVPVTLTIQDVHGRRIATLLNRRMEAPGRHEAVWDGRDDGGARVAPGVYFGVLRLGSQIQTRKIVLAR